MTGPILLDLLGVMVNPRCSRSFSAFLMAKSSTMMNRKGASVSPCRTPASISNSSLSLSGVTTLAVVPVYVASIAQQERRDAVSLQDLDHFSSMD